MQATVLYTTPPLTIHLPGFNDTGHRNYWVIILYIFKNSMSCKAVIPYYISESADKNITIFQCPHIQTYSLATVYADVQIMQM